MEKKQDQVRLINCGVVALHNTVIGHPVVSVGGTAVAVLALLLFLVQLILNERGQISRQGLKKKKIQSPNCVNAGNYNA